MKTKIVISVNTSWNLINFRTGLIQALLNSDYEVFAIAPEDEYSEKLKQLGCKFIPINIDNNGINPVRDFILFINFFFLLRRIKPQVFLGYTIKPNIYGSIAAGLLKIPTINNIAGLGTVFIKKSIITKLVKKLYFVSLRKSKCVFFQNRDDQELFVKSKIVTEAQSDYIPGSGIDLNKYSPTNLTFKKSSDNALTFLFIGRILRDKGVVEFVEAARIVKKHYPNTQFQLLGAIDNNNPNAIKLEQIREWETQGVISFLGKQEDVRDYIKLSDCIVLPSYREGLPRVLLEGAAMQRPLIATDVPGCKDVVDHRVNGLLCRVKCELDLAEKIIEMINISPQKREEFGLNGRKKIMHQFNEKIIVDKYSQTIRKIIKN